MKEQAVFDHSRGGGLIMGAAVLPAKTDSLSLTRQAVPDSLSSPHCSPPSACDISHSIVIRRGSTLAR